MYDFVMAMIGTWSVIWGLFMFVVIMAPIAISYITSGEVEIEWPVAEFISDKLGLKIKHDDDMIAFRVLLMILPVMTWAFFSIMPTVMWTVTIIGGIVLCAKKLYSVKSELDKLRSSED